MPECFFWFFRPSEQAWLSETNKNLDLLLKLVFSLEFRFDLLCPLLSLTLEKKYQIRKLAIVAFQICRPIYGGTHPFSSENSSSKTGLVMSITRHSSWLLLLLLRFSLLRDRDRTLLVLEHTEHNWEKFGIKKYRHRPGQGRGLLFTNEKQVIFILISWQEPLYSTPGQEEVKFWNMMSNLALRRIFWSTASGLLGEWFTQLANRLFIKKWYDFFLSTTVWKISQILQIIQSLILDFYKAQVSESKWCYHGLWNQFWNLELGRYLINCKKTRYKTGNKNMFHVPL